MTDRDLSTGGCGARRLRHHSETSRRLRSAVVLAPVSDITDITPSAGDAPRETGRSELLSLGCSIGAIQTERTREAGTLQQHTTLPVLLHSSHPAHAQHTAGCMMLGACRHTDAHNATSACELLRTRSRHVSLTRSYLPEQVTTVLQVAADSE